MPPFTLNHIDHVALRVVDLERSIKWYTTYLNFKELDTPEWNRYPAMIGNGNFFIALFSYDQNQNARQSDIICIDHFAFNLSKVDYEKAKEYFTKKQIKYREQDHIYSQSIYLDDPDGHVVELTTIIKLPSLINIANH